MSWNKDLQVSYWYNCKTNVHLHHLCRPVEQPSLNYFAMCTTSWSMFSIVWCLSLISLQCPYIPWINACFARLSLFWNILQAFTCASLCWICNLCFSWCVVDTTSLLLCQLHHLLCELFRAESCSSPRVLAAAHTIFLDSKEWSSIIVKYQYPFIQLSINTAWGFSSPSSSKESKLRTTEKVGFILVQRDCMVRRGLKKDHPPPPKKKTPSFHHWEGELRLYRRRMGDICSGNSEMKITLCSVNICM